MWPIAIAAGASLLGALLSQKAQEEENRKNREYDAVMRAYDARREGEMDLGRAEQNGLAQLMATYKGALA